MIGGITVEMLVDNIVNTVQDVRLEQEVCLWNQILMVLMVILPDIGRGKTRVRNYRETERGGEAETKGRYVL